MSYRIKWIPYKGTHRPILLQNENGPCPLIAICNILFLRGEITISKDYSFAAFDQLSQLVASHIIKRNSLDREISDETRENLRQALNDAVAWLPTLAHGMDVNCRFTSIRDFEFTSQLSVFDLLNISLVHGWVVDPQDEATALVVGSNSYNQLMDKIIAMHSLAEAPVASAALSSAPSVPAIVPESSNDNIVTPEPSPSHASRLIGDSNPVDPHNSNLIIEPLPAQDVEGEQQRSNDILSSAEKKEEETPFVDVPELQHHEEDVAQLSEALQLSLSVSRSADSSAAPAAPAPAEQVPSDEPVAVPAPATVDRDRVFWEGSVIQEFLDSTSSQLTYFGLAALHEGMREGELSVFFRNNHFATLLKQGGLLYLLLTDEGYFNEQNAIWELLQEVEGDNPICNGQFRVFQAPKTPPRSQSNNSTLQARRPSPIRALPQPMYSILPQASGSVSSAVQPQQQQQQPVYYPGNGIAVPLAGMPTPLPAHSPHIVPHQLHQQPQVIAPTVDPDLLYALQLHNEELRAAGQLPMPMPAVPPAPQQQQFEHSSGSAFSSSCSPPQQQHGRSQPIASSSSSASALRPSPANIVRLNAPAQRYQAQAQTLRELAAERQQRSGQPLTPKSAQQQQLMQQQQQAAIAAAARYPQQQQQQPIQHSPQFIEQQRLAYEQAQRESYERQAAAAASKGKKKKKQKDSDSDDDSGCVVC